MIKKFSLIFLFCLLVASCSTQGIASRPDDLGLGKISFEMHKPETWILSNGLKVFYQYDDELPLISGVLYVPGGSLFDPKDRPGLAQATGSLIREGGIEGKQPDRLDQILNDLGATIESSFGKEYGSVGFSALAEDFETVFDLFSQIIKKPGFDKTRLDLWKKLALEGISRRQDSPDTMAEMSIKKLIFGEGSPYANYLTPESVASISPVDLKKFHKRFFNPSAARLAISGSVPKDQLNKALEKYFSNWTVSKETILSDLPKPLTHSVSPGIYILDRDLDQTTIYIGHPGPGRFTEDKYAIDLFNEYFSAGSWGSVLFSEIRSRLGLVYSVFGGFFPGMVNGVFQIDLASRNDEAIRSTKRVLELIEEVKNSLPNENQVLVSRASVERSYVFGFAESEAIVKRSALLDLLKFPDNYDQTYLDNLAKISREDLLTVAKSRLNPDDLVIIIVGKINTEAIIEEFGGKKPIFKLAFGIEPKVGERLS